MLIRIADYKWVHHNEIRIMMSNGCGVIFFLAGGEKSERGNVTMAEIFMEAIKP